MLYTQVTISNNSAGVVGTNRLATNSSGSASSSQSANTTGSSSGAGEGGGIGDSSSSASDSSACMLSPLLSLSHFERAVLRDITLTNNTATVVLDVNGFSLQQPVQDVLIADNFASGMRLVSTQPKYNGQGIGLLRVRVLRNTLSRAAPYVGGLVIGGFNSPVGSLMPVEIRDCEFVGNRPADTSEQVGPGCLSAGVGPQVLQPMQAPVSADVPRTTTTPAAP